MKTQNYTIGQRLMAYILIVGLFLQSCNNPYVGPSFNKEQPITKEEQPNSTTLFLETPPLANELREPIQKEELVTQRADSWLGDELATTAKHKTPESQLGTSSLLAASSKKRGLATNPRITSMKPRQLTQVLSKLPSTEKTKSKPVRKRLQTPNLVHAREEQLKASSTSSLITEQTPQQAKQAVEKAPMLTKGRYQIMFEKTSEGAWKALVNESFQIGISRKIELPVFFELGYNFSHVADSHWVHVIEEGARSFIWVGSVGIKGGMHQQEDGDNNNRSDSNSNRNNSKAEVIPSYLSGKLKYFYQVGSHLVGMVHKATSSFISNNSKAEVTTQAIPSDLSGKLKYLYQQDNTLPKLIEDEDIPDQSIQNYYVKLQVVLQENFDQERSAAAKDQVVGEKKPVEVDKLFDEIDKDHPAVSKVLLLGGAGIGKSTLMHYISYQWARGKLWKDKYEHVFRVRLKDLLDANWLIKYTRDEMEEGLLACFIHHCLSTQKIALATKGNKQIKGAVYKLDEIQQLLKDPHKKEKVLLLVDGYDEIASLKSKPEYKQILDSGVFEHPKVIMTSRPNAASKEIRGKFERQVESQGLDEEGTSQYINLQFNQEPALGEELKAFLFGNSQVRSMCEVPINTALLCITWKNPTTRAKLGSSTSIQTDFKLGQLYHELIVWLGKRYAIKYNPAHKDPKVLRELPDEAVLEEEVFKALERIAYQSFTGVDLEDQARQGGTLGIPGQLVANLARKEGKLSLTQLHQYGLLRGEGDPNKPLEQVYYFIHLSFQEYLTAHRLCKLLSQADKAAVAKVATWIAHHRNEPKYLMTFKFLSGLVSQSRDGRLVKRFWEAMSCNVDGVIELGVEGKVKLFMHLLSQSKIGDQFDQRIPNVEQIAKLVDDTLQGDLLKWEQAIIEAGYYPTWLQEAASKVLAEGIGLARKASLREEDRMKLQTAANLLSKMVNQGGRLSRKQLFDQSMQLIALKDWQLQKLGLEKAREVVDKTVPAKKIEESAKYIARLLVDANLYRAARGLFAKLCQIDKGVFKQIRPLLAHSDGYLRICAADALIKTVPLVPELRKEVLEALKPLLADSNKHVRRSAAYALGEIVLLVPELRKEVLEALKPLLADSDEYVRSIAYNDLIDVLKLVPELGKEVLEALKPLLADRNEDVRRSAADALKEIVPLAPELGKEVLEALKPLLADSDEYVQISAADASIEILKLVPKLGKEVWVALKPLLAGSIDYLQSSAADALIEIVQSDPGIAREVLEALKPLLADSDEYVQIFADNALRKIVKLVPIKEVWEALKPLLADSNYNVRSSAAYALIEIVKSVPELRKEVLEALKPLLADSHEDVRRSVANALIEIVKLVPELGKEGMEALKPLLADSNVNVRICATRALGEIVPLVPELGKEAVEALKPLLADEYGYVRSSAADALREIVQSVPFNQQVSLLTDAHPAVRNQAKEALAATLKSPAAIVQLNHQAVGSLLEIIRENRDQQEELAKALYTGATKGLASIAENLHAEGLSFLNEHLNNLQRLNLPEGQAFLKAVIHHTLQDGVIDLQAAALLIKCIVERGLTATINPQTNQIILEDTTYTLQPAAQANLTHVVNEVIRLSTDSIAQQYKFHQPLFKNSGEGLPIATTDIEKAVSILNKTALDSNSWHVSVLDLSGHHQSKPSKMFILLEQRNYAGQHIIHQLELHQGEGKVSFHAINPLAVDQIKEEIFGELYVMNKASYYGYSFTLSQKLGEQLIEVASQMKGMVDSYSALHGLAGDYQAMQDNQKGKVSDLLSLPWDAYSKDPAVKTYEKEEVYGKAMGSGGINVHFNIGNVEKLNVENVENLKAENIEELNAKNVTNVNVENLIN